MSNSIQSTFINRLCVGLYHINDYAKLSLFLLTVLLFTASTSEATVIDTINNTVSRVENTVNRIETKVNNVNTNINTKVGNVQTSLQDMPNIIQTKLGVSIDPDAKNKIFEVFQDMRDMIEAERDNLVAFGDGSPGTGCFDLRVGLIGIFDGLSGMNNTLSSFGGTPILIPDIIDVSEIAQLLNAVPCQALLPLGLVFQQISMNVFADQFTQSNNLLTTVSPFFSPVNNVLSCEVVDQQRDIYKGAAIGIGGFSLLLRGIAAKIDPDEVTGGIDALKFGFVNQGDKIIGIHGYGSLTLKHPEKPKKIAAGLKVLSELLGAVSATVFTKTRHCEVVLKQDEILDNQDKIMQGLCFASRGTSPACP